MLAAFSKNLRVWRTEKIETVTDMNCQILRLAIRLQCVMKDLR